MRGRWLVLPLAALPMGAGCTAVFGISDGQYDSDPFGRLDGAVADGAASQVPEAAPNDDAAAPPIDGAGPLPDGIAPHDSATDAPPPDAGPPPCTALLDDLEDGDGWILRCIGRGGPWYAYNDGSPGGSQSPTPGRPFLPEMPGHASTYAAHTSGKGFTARGAGVGFDLDNPAGNRATYDLSAYKGLTFWAKSATAFHMYVNFPDKDTDPAGGVCTKCNDSWGKGIDITAAWAQYTVTFAELGTDGIGAPAPAGFDPAHVYSIEFHAAPNAVFDYWVDDISLSK
ncbi:MAG TPA: hypothetical protein VGI39_06370 [Polyangiaceae bacterium]|jgi:hypothetical protein